MFSEACIGRIRTGRISMRTKLKPISDIEVADGMKVKDLTAQMFASGGFTAKKLGQACNILRKMLRADRSFIFFSFPACIVSTGARGVIRKLVEEKLVDVIITTCGTLDHDLARAWREA